jgi:hypothetical protein
MIKRKPYHCLVALLCAFFFLVGIGAPMQPSYALDLGGLAGDVLKVAGIGFLVKQFGPEIDKFINSALGTRGIGNEGMTKVVPIIRLGSGTAVGAVQVVGPASQVQKVKAVAEIEITFGNHIRGRALVPISMSKFNVQTIHGVGGVGVSANIKFVI